MLFADHLTSWDERMGSAAPILVSLTLAVLAVLAVWVVRLRRHGLPDRGPGTVGIVVGLLVGGIVYARLHGETAAFAELWNGIFLQDS